MSISSRLNLGLTTFLSKKKKSSFIRQKYSKFNLKYFLIASIPLLSFGAFNIAIDPYGVFNTPYFQGNHEKPEKDNNDRLFKTLDIIRIKPVTVILGSSRTKRGLNPEYPALKDKQVAYNLAINGPNIYEVRRYLEHAIANQKDLKLVILGIDFFMFNANLKNQPSFSDNRLGKTHIILNDAINTIFSLDTFYTSLDTLETSLNTPETPQGDSYGKNGFMPHINVENVTTTSRFNFAINFYFETHNDYRFSEEYLAEFQKIVDLCQQHNIELKVFVSPTHATDNEAIRITGRWPTYERWLEKIVEITPVWDFSGYNSITIEPVSDLMNNYADSSHYTPKIGNLVLNKIFAYKEETVPTDFGVKISPGNIKSHLAKIRSDRQVWAKNNPKDLKLVEEIKNKFDLAKKLTK